MNATFIFHKEKYLDTALTHRLQFFSHFLKIWSNDKQQSSSKILKHLSAFPLPQSLFGYFSGLSASKYAWLNIGEGEGALQWEQKCEE